MNSLKKSLELATLPPVASSPTMTTNLSKEEIIASLEKHNAAFETLINYIPPHFYLGREALEVSDLLRAPGHLSFNFL